ncbi:Pectinesterase, catalytic [Dillenia turbinata]|uniref:Pectinesterase n=1 Tax=Dillenia turbinata TaxID=194707 RepID=A0AAN8VWC5_9MAGN
MVGKVVVSLVSLILVVGAVIGVVVGVKSFGNSNGGGNGNSIDNGNDVSATQKAVQTICSAAEYKESCEKTLSQVGNGTSDPKAYIQAAFESSLKQVDSAFALSKTLTVPNNNSRIQMGVDDCKDMLEFAVQNLQASMSMVGDNDMHTVKDRLRELQSWLSSVITYQQTCADSLSEAEAPELKSVMENGMVDATKLTDNALVVVKKVTEILEAFDIKLPNLNGAGRRLLGNTEEVDKEGYPTWFSTADRKLLAKTDNGNVKPNVVVAKDGSGNFKTIQEAVNACPKNNKGRFIIYVKAGIYKEYVTIPKDKANIYMYGDGPRKTMLGDLIHPDGWYPFETNMDYIKTLTFREYANTGPGANTAKRVKWNTVKVATKQEAQTFTAGPFLRGDQWLPATTVPFNLGFFK